MYFRIVYICHQCKQLLFLSNSNKVFEESVEFYAINLSSVLSSLSTGLGFAGMNEIFSLHGIKYMNEEQYSKNQLKIEEIIKKELDKSLQINLDLEKDIAIEEGNFDGGYPTISCIGDGRWSKRSYNFNYTANSSTAVLIGSNTRKIVYIGVKNKYCRICQKEVGKDKRKSHDCSKNWIGPSTSMESALILEGFIDLENKGVRVLQYIGDQDSSVIQTIMRHFEWEHKVSKIDCINHKIRNLTTYLIKWKKV